MLAYVFWHRPAQGEEQYAYEQALLRFHRSLAHQPPAGLLATAALRAPQLPWLPGEGGGYEDWYLVESWSALGVLEAAAVSHGHETAHREAARRAGAGAAGVYRLIEGDARPADARLAVWVTRPAGQIDPTMADLLDDGVEPATGSLWQRALVLGPAPEFCLLHTQPALPPDTGVAASRLPSGWNASASPREPAVG
jgi:hypothetical protein